MLKRIRNYRLSIVVALAITAAGLGALTIPSQPAKAQAWFGVQVGPFGFGVGGPGYYYYPPYYAPYPAYPGYYYTNPYDPDFDGGY